MSVAMVIKLFAEHLGFDWVLPVALNSPYSTLILKEAEANKSFIFFLLFKGIFAIKCQGFASQH